MRYGPREPSAPFPAPLPDVVAYVEVWSANGTENYSKTFTNQLVEMGAKVSKTFNKRVTHVVFKDGHQRTWDKAQARGVKLVSVLWVEQCRTAGVHADEALFPAARPPERLPCLVRRKHKCMQPKDFTPKTPENDKRLQKKFEKMANELQRQRTTLDDDVPVLLFEPSGSLVYSPTAAVQRGRHLAMEKRLQEMKEKRENLSLTSSQLTEESHDGSACAAAPSTSHDALCSDDPFAGGRRPSPGELCGDAGCGHQDRGQGGPAGATWGAACLSAPDPETRSTHPPASPQRRSLWTPRKPTRPVPEEEGGGRRDPAGGAVTPDAGPSARVLSMWGETCSLSPAPPAPAGRLVGRPGPGGFSAKRGRGSQCGESPPEGGLKRRKCGREPPAPGVRLFEAEQCPQLEAGPADEPPDCAASSYEDYFSPENLRERSAETRPPGRWSPPSPARLRGAAGLSKRQRRSVLEAADFSCLGRSLASPDLASSTPKTSARLRGPPGVRPASPLGPVAPETPPAAEEAPGRPRRGEAEAEAETREGAGPEESRRPCADPELAGPPARPGDTAPTNGGDKGGDRGAQDSVGVFAGVREEEPPPRAPRPSEGESQRGGALSSVGD